MSNLSKITEWMTSQIGTKESDVGDNNVRYNTVYYGGEVSGSQYPWCCVFIYIGFQECGLSNLFCGGQKTAYCPFVVNYAKANNQWVTANYQQGDLLLYDWDGDGVADHIGFCESASTSTVSAIEGNYLDRVDRVSRAYTNILGAYRVNYGEATSDSEPAQSSSAASTSDTYTVKSGDTLWSIAQAQLGDGCRYGELLTWNGLTSDYIYPGQVLKLHADESSSASDAAAPAAETEDGYYTVQAGDTLWSIAEKFLGSGIYYTKIYEWNGLQTDMIKLGQKLKVKEN